MNRYSLCLLLTSILLSRPVIGKSQANTLKPSFIPSYLLPVTYQKTTILVFPYSITSVDRGSREVLVQKAAGLDNVLQVKAGLENFMETNLTVFTADGTLYSFLVRYAADPIHLNLSFCSGVPGADHKNNRLDVPQTASRIATSPASGSIAKKNKYRMQIQLHDLIVQQDILFLPLQLTNHSNIPFAVGSLRFYIRDQTSSKRTAVHEVELHPLYLHNLVQSLEANSSTLLVVALPVFTIPDQKKLYIEVMEQGGGRHLQLKVHNRRLWQAKPLQ